MDADAILALRTRLEWTQERLAEYLGVDRSTVSRIETGQEVSGPVDRLLRQLDSQGASDSDSAASDPVEPQTNTPGQAA